MASETRKPDSVNINHTVKFINFKKINRSQNLKRCWWFSFSINI